MKVGLKKEFFMRFLAPKKEKKLPSILSQDEVLAILGSNMNLKHKANL
jgi:site-specific recombinase XerD